MVTTSEGGPMTYFSPGHWMANASQIETRFSNEDSMAYLESIFDEPSDDSAKKIEKVVAIMESLPPREADFVDMYYFKKLKQTDIALIFKVSQPTVCYRLQRATSRIQFLLQLPEADPAALRKDMQAFLTDPLDVNIMCLMYETTCQSEVAKRLKVSQGLVRHRFIRSLNRMRHIARLSAYVVLFDFISKNLNILREVQRPAWDSRMTHALD
jgi:DNA-directed RNA polymerase specialized sigma24 family protein